MATENPKTFRKAIELARSAEKCLESLKLTRTDEICSIVKKEAKNGGKKQEPEDKDASGSESEIYNAPIYQAKGSINQQTRANYNTNSKNNYMRPMQMEAKREDSNSQIQNQKQLRFNEP